MTLSHKKISLLHVAKARLGIDDEAWRDMLTQAAGVSEGALVAEMRPSRTAGVDRYC